ncbi:MULTISPECIES: M64 family metallopeptidase [unclassified Crossiella]|uniref:M64 family metallopeptidase n=1 Tax=unclassified Crossiella TaxID=2620835 RepID=UPI001FFFAF11|nr:MULTISPECIES: M64 family metallopeptidase [unclassified Crossiella]MCK2238552.1 M64 family metallopeptidase [Crossiella sp. S99.2]MCK2251878.1 M64 family metallopeptidase [Crossiella sp. S99.1]
MVRRTAALLGALALAASVLLAAGPAQADPAAPPGTVVPVQVTGDPAKRFNLVIVPDGYTSADLPKFREHVDKHLNVLWTIEPFKSYRSYLNVYTVEIASPESGVSCDPDISSPRRNTPLRMGFWGGCNPSGVRRLLTVDSTAVVNYANLVPGTTAANRQILAIANSDTYGGAGGTYATASGGNALSALITPHELGHSLGGLQDEYDYLNRGVRGGAYTGGEPDSVHHSLLTEAQMRDQKKKWWRWLGEPSESGGMIGRFEAGMYASTGVWRPSKHSMMKTLGYYFDQPTRERMVERLSGKTSILQDSTPNTAPIGADRVVWAEPLHPVSHSLTVTWTLDGTPLSTNGSRSVDLTKQNLTPGRHTLLATVTDPTEFVRDPAIRASAALTRTRTWTIDTSLTTPRPNVPADFLAHTPTNRPVGGGDVVYVQTTRPAAQEPPVTWTLDGRQVSTAVDNRDLNLKSLKLTPGRHTLTATTGAATRTWTVDAQAPATSFELSKPLLTRTSPTGDPEYVFNAPFTMRLKATDDTQGFVVPEFRTNGDGWYNYFGWPTDASAPFRFTPNGTNIDDLIYGKLGTPRLSPWDNVPPGYGRHTIDYRAIDPAGNTGTPGRFAVTLLREPPACTTTITGRHTGPLVVNTGVTCLNAATVTGPLTVSPGATLVATESTITGPVRTDRAVGVHLLNSTIVGPTALTGTTGDVTVVGGRIVGALRVSDSTATDRGPVLAGVAVTGPVQCRGNATAPDNLGAPITGSGPATGQCAVLR